MKQRKQRKARPKPTMAPPKLARVRAINPEVQRRLDYIARVAAGVHPDNPAYYNVRILSESPPVCGRIPEGPGYHRWV